MLNHRTKQLVELYAKPTGKNIILCGSGHIRDTADYLSIPTLLQASTIRVYSTTIELGALQSSNDLSTLLLPKYVFLFKDFELFKAMAEVDELFDPAECFEHDDFQQVNLEQLIERFSKFVVSQLSTDVNDVESAISTSDLTTMNNRIKNSNTSFS